MWVSSRNGYSFLLRQGQSQRPGSKLFGDGAVLLVETRLKCFFTVRVERKQIKVVIRSAVQHSSAKIDRGIDERGGGAAIFRLDVISRIARLHVGIVTEKHFQPCSHLPMIECTCQNTPPPISPISLRIIIISLPPIH